MKFNDNGYSEWFNALEDMRHFRVGAIAQAYVKTKNGHLLTRDTMIHQEHVDEMNFSIRNVLKLISQGHSAELKYRIRKPKGIAVLEDALKGLGKRND